MPFPTPDKQDCDSGDEQEHENNSNDDPDLEVAECSYWRYAGVYVIGRGWLSWCCDGGEGESGGWCWDRK